MPQSIKNEIDGHNARNSTPKLESDDQEILKRHISKHRKLTSDTAMLENAHNTFNALDEDQIEEKEEIEENNIIPQRHENRETNCKPKCDANNVNINEISHARNH